MGDIIREMTLKEEIEALSIDDIIKERLLRKLKEYDYMQKNNREEIMAKCSEEIYSKVAPLKKANAALMTACESLSAAMIAQKEVRNNI